MKYDICTLGFVLKHKGKIIDDAIRFFSNGDAAHTFCVVGENEVFEMHCPKGAITRPLTDYTKDPKYCVMFAEPIGLAGIKKVLIKDALLKKVGKVKYDFRGVTGHLLKFPDKINSSEREYCSEAIGLVYAEYANYYFMGLPPRVQTPGQQAYDCIARQDKWEITFSNALSQTSA